MKFVQSEDILYPNSQIHAGIFILIVACELIELWYKTVM